MHVSKGVRLRITGQATLLKRAKFKLYRYPFAALRM
jgi:hypothetical protein